MHTTKKEYLDAAAQKAFEELANNPHLGVPLDPDVAEHMGIFEEDAVSLADIDSHVDIDMDDIITGEGYAYKDGQK